AEFTIGEGELMAHDVPLGCAPDEYDDLISGTCSHLPLMSFSSRNDSTALLFSGGRYPLKYPFILMIILMFRFSAWRVQILW
ncbi:hypothetical protein, partial [Escherichia coli]